MLPRLGDHFTVYTSIESLHCTTKTKVMLYVSYIAMKKYSRWKIVSFGGWTKFFNSQLEKKLFSSW